MKRELDLFMRLGPLAQAGAVEQAVAFGDVVVMDVCNPIARRDGEAIVKSVNQQGGAGLASAKLLPGARIVRAFNGISYRRVGEMATGRAPRSACQSPATIRRLCPSRRG